MRRKRVGGINKEEKMRRIGGKGRGGGGSGGGGGRGGGGREWGGG